MKKTTLFLLAFSPFLLLGLGVFILTQSYLLFGFVLGIGLGVYLYSDAPPPNNPQTISQDNTEKEPNVQATPAPLPSPAFVMSKSGKYALSQTEDAEAEQDVQIYKQLKTN